MSFDHVCVIGLGYVGLPTAAVLASRGVNVTGVDINPTTVDTINDGKPHIVEPDLDMVVHGAVSAGKLRAGSAPVEADAFIIAVPTPFTENHQPDLSYLEQATTAVADVIKAGDLVVVESTVPVGATAQVGKWIAEARPDLRVPNLESKDAAHDIYIAHSPERVLPGRVLLELVRNDRVIGGLGPDCAKRTAELYGVVVEGDLHLTNAPTAELVKLSENAYRDVNIAFANELANVSEKLDIDVREVITLANRHPRVEILKPGPGVGGHCIAVDPWFIVATNEKQTPLIQAARRVNDGRPQRIAARIAESKNVQDGKAIGCLGLSYKADIDDLRESPSVDVVLRLRQLVSNPIYIVEPHIDQLPESLKEVPKLIFASIEETLEACHVIALLTDHRAFGTIEPSRLVGKDVIDSRGLWRITTE